MAPLTPQTMTRGASSTAVVALAAGLLAVAAACGTPPASKTRLSIATGGTGGVFYPYGGGIAKVI
jgi:TRAP-type uncharacterized transport system substrate-binding protein